MAAEAVAKAKAQAKAAAEERAAAAEFAAAEAMVAAEAVTRKPAPVEAAVTPKAELNFFAQVSKALGCGVKD